MNREVRELHVVKCFHCGKKIGVRKPNAEQMEKIGVNSCKSLIKGLLLSIGWHIPLTEKKPYVCSECWPNVKYMYRNVGEVEMSNQSIIEKYKEVMK